MTAPLDNVRDISRIAYGFMASNEGFEHAEVIPGITRAITAVKPRG